MTEEEGILVLKYSHDVEDCFIRLCYNYIIAIISKSCFMYLIRPLPDDRDVSRMTVIFIVFQDLLCLPDDSWA